MCATKPRCLTSTKPFICLFLPEPIYRKTYLFWEIDMEYERDYLSYTWNITKLNSQTHRHERKTIVPRVPGWIGMGRFCSKGPHFWVQRQSNFWSIWNSRVMIINRIYWVRYSGFIPALGRQTSGRFEARLSYKTMSQTRMFYVSRYFHFNFLFLLWLTGCLESFFDSH